MGKWTRRAVIGAGGLLGGGLVLGVGTVVFAPNRMRIFPKDAGDGNHLTTWINITPDNQITALIPHCEMGQGALTGLAMMLAEELEAAWSDVLIEEAPAESRFANGYMLRGFLEEGGVQIPQWLERALDYTSYRVTNFVGLQITGGSSSTRATGQYGMRVAGAAAKAMLLEAAAQRWNVAVSECAAQQSRVLHAATNRSASFGELASDAALLEPPQHPILKLPGQYSIVGTRRPRRDIPSKIDGSAQYGIDVELPDMLYATIAAAPVPGGRLSSVDPAPADAMPGVRAVVELEDAVAVVADGYWQALQALRVLEPVFTDADRGDMTTEKHYAAHAEMLNGNEHEVEPGTDDRLLTFEYRVPYLAHATMEPMCATARIADGRCELWAGTQDPLNARHAAADAAGLAVDDVVVHNLQLGGGFGRRLPFSFDYIDQAVRVAQAMSPSPIKLIWSREEDMQHDYYRPAVLARFQGVLDAHGVPQTWACDCTGQGMLDRLSATPIYSVPNVDIRVHELPVHLRVGSWRSVASSQHGFFMETFIDELAHAAEQDPYRYRHALLIGKPRHQAVLDRAAQMSNWGDSLPPGQGRGIAIVECFGTVVAEVAQVSVDGSGKLRVHRVDAAVDCASVVNPDQALAQIEGGVLFGLSAALFHEITIRDGAVEQSSFPDFEMLRLADAPSVHVEFLESDSPLGGLGEPAVPPIAPAVGNAIFAATGQRLRSLPFKSI